MPTNVFTTVTIGEEQYSIKKFDAKTGLKIARMVIAKAAPLIPLLEKSEDKTDTTLMPNKPDKPGKDDKIAKVDDSAIYEVVGTILDTLSDSDVDDLVDKCLRVCYLNLPAGLPPSLMKRSLRRGGCRVRHGADDSPVHRSDQVGRL